MTSQNRFYPHSTRNRIALLLSLLSLGLFITWNSLPYPWSASGEKPTITAIHFWPSIVRGITHFMKEFTVDLDEVIFLTDSFALLLLVIVVFTTPFSWKILGASRILRIVPASLMLIGVFVSAYFIPGSIGSGFLIPLTCISTNFLLSAIALFLFKNESAEHDDHGISST